MSLKKKLFGADGALEILRNLGLQKRYLFLIKFVIKFNYFEAWGRQGHFGGQDRSHFHGLKSHRALQIAHWWLRFFVSNPHGTVRFKRRKKGSLSFSGIEIAPCPADNRFVVAFVVSNPHGTVRFRETKGRHLDLNCKIYLGESPILEICSEMASAKSTNERIT